MIDQTQHMSQFAHLCSPPLNFRLLFSGAYHCSTCLCEKQELSHQWPGMSRRWSTPPKAEPLTKAGEELQRAYHTASAGSGEWRTKLTIHSDKKNNILPVKLTFPFFHWPKNKSAKRNPPIKVLQGWFLGPVMIKKKSCCSKPPTSLSALNAVK